MTSQRCPHPKGRVVKVSNTENDHTGSILGALTGGLAGMIIGGLLFDDEVTEEFYYCKDCKQKLIPLDDD